MNFLEEMRKSRASLIELLNGIEVKYNYPVNGCLSVSKHTGFQKGIGIIAKILLEESNPYFEFERCGKKLKFDLKIGDSRYGSPSRHYFFNQGEDIGLVEKFSIGLGCSSSEFYFNGKNEDNKYLADNHFMAGISKVFDLNDYFGDYKSLIDSLELRLGRKIIDKKLLVK